VCVVTHHLDRSKHTWVWFGFLSLLVRSSKTYRYFMSWNIFWASALQTLSTVFFVYIMLLFTRQKVISLKSYLFHFKN
jgi:hypothetical protein